jgi:GT2 family glycosyltransferase
MKLSIVIVSWNVQDKLLSNLKSIFNSITDFDFEVWVVDNNSSDETVKMVTSLYPQIKLIKNQENFGFARANNQAIRNINSQFILLLNPDMQLNTDTLQKMVDWMTLNDNASVAGCRLINQENVTITSVRRFPALFDQALIILKIPHFFPTLLDGYLRKDFDYNKASRVDSIRGGFFMINTYKFTKMPFLDERYFLWFEEVDFCKMIKHNGEEVWYTPDASCIDLVGQSFKQIKRFKAQKYFRDSMLKYFLKWHGWPSFMFLYMLWSPMIAFAWLIDFINIKGGNNT